MSSLEFELILPCYNESKSVEALIQRTLLAAKTYNYTPEQFQLVLVENGSKDNSKEVLQTLKHGPLGVWFRIVEVVENKGYGFGLWSGLKSTQAKYVGWSHADQQCDPMDAFKALSILKVGPGPALVKGVRGKRNWKDQIVSRVFEGIASVLLGKSFHEINAQPKVFPSALLSLIKNPPYDFAFDLYVLYQAHKAQYEIRAIPVDFPPRIHGMSNWSAHFWSRHRHIRNMIIYIWNLSRKEGRL